MLQTLFWIPNRIAGFPLFGKGVLALAWLGWMLAYALWQWRRRGWSNELLQTLGLMGLIAGAIVFVVPGIMVTNPATGQPGIAIRGYGVMLVAGIVAGVGLTLYRAKRVGVQADVVYSVALWAFVAGIVGARVFYVVEYWDDLKRPTIGQTLAVVVNLTQGGLVVFGAFLGAAAAIIVFARRNKLPLLALLDLTAPGMTLGLAFGRIGCFFNGCCFGGMCDAPWAVEFPPNSPPHIRQVENAIRDGSLLGFKFSASEAAASRANPPVVGRVEPNSPAAAAGLTVGAAIKSIDGVKVTDVEQAQATLIETILSGAGEVKIVAGETSRTLIPDPRWSARSRPVHPAQIYASFDAILLTLLLLAFGSVTRRDGETFALMITVHPVSRFLLEQIRIDESGMFGTPLSISQIISLAMLAAAVGLWILLERLPRGFAWPRQAAGAVSAARVASSAAK